MEAIALNVRDFSKLSDNKGEGKAHQQSQRYLGEQEQGNGYIRTDDDGEKYHGH